ncbi:hypothetical protein Mmc1_2791 [Magnetococcus marinus MC-1]|uniref:DUF6844 domain-containing protein n=1 Tax=Magnetococcus marinus (strain ATCC BAA-1437 / JCM 17883 / MC-1) TaxID=156889 RepID=A0LBE1_MAGMM|nr:hypothetical protein [Magnetococcus marinus]ABK45284.1 hypothetical protein Mmc1_2791 [Magnetococcus marinus MC-1]
MKTLIAMAFSAGMVISPVVTADTCQSNGSVANASEMLDKQVRAFNGSSFGSDLIKRAEAGRLVLLKSDVMSVDKSVDSPQFTQSRDFAYAKALANVQAKFILKKQTESQAQIVSERYDASPASAEYGFPNDDAGSRNIRIGDKSVKLVEAKLDNALRAEGVSEQEIRSASREKKVDLFRESLAHAAARRAFGAATGLIPVKSFETVDCNGRAAVLLVAVYSEKNRNFVNAILHSESIVAAPELASGVPFETQVGNEIDDGSVVYEWGIRKLYDSHGYPVLASYGQWGYAPHQGMPKANERRKRSALTQADAGAYEQMTLFLDSQANFSNETSSSEFANSFVRVTETAEGVQKTEEEVSEIVTKSIESFRTKGKVKLAGLSNPIHWDLAYPHKGAQARVVGSVLYWSPHAEDAINIATGKRARRVISNKEETPAPGVDHSMIGGSKVRNNVDDF